MKFCRSTADASVGQDELQFDGFVPVGAALENLRTREIVGVMPPRHLTATTVRRAIGSSCAASIMSGDEWRRLGLGV
ncbi:MAG: hypothetical protein HYZ81_23845 [Nitrospinae bacterium]|nr:hypothetical protein [Nitrospinota bacterium]